jgi:hypothetical protein
MSEVSPAILLEQYKLSDNILNKLNRETQPDICKLTTIIYDGRVSLAEFNQLDDANMSQPTRDMFYQISEDLDDAIVKAHPEFASKLEIPILND